MASEFLVDFPTLGDLLDAWYAQHLRVPDGFRRGDRLVQSDWQFWCTANHYRVREDAEWRPDNPLLNQAFVFRRSQIVGPQKTGKGPWAAAITAGEAVGPVIFGGWAGRGDGYACADHGCSCGFEYEYLPGEPMGIRHPSPLIQLTANSEDQVQNVYRPLTAMIRLGPLSDLLKVREGFIRIVGESDDEDMDRIDVVTSSARSRLGNPISFALQDETGLYTTQNKMVEVAEAQRRGAAGMGGRTMETTNAWNPAENSTAQRTWESDAADVFKFFRQPPPHLSYRNKRERRQIHEYVYNGSPWVTLDSIEAEASELMQTDPAQAERFFGNRLVSGSGAWLAEPEKWDERARPVTVKPRTKVALGFDGSDNNDWTGIRCETQNFYQFTPTYRVGAEDRPAIWNPKNWGDRIPRSEVLAAFEQIAKNFEIVRAYLDPKFWESEIDALATKYGEKVFVKWHTNRVSAMHASLERFRTDIVNSDSRFTHDGDQTTRTHIRNAVTKAYPGERYLLAKPNEHQKIDMTMSSVLAHEATNDAIVAGDFESNADAYAFVY